MALDLVGVDCFVAVARCRHFGHAARELGVTVSTVTKRLQRLETQLGVPLVLRNSSGFLGLSPAGQRFLEVAPALLRSARLAEDALRGRAEMTLRIAVPDGVGAVAPLMPEALGTLELALRHTYPGVAVLTVPTPFPLLTQQLLGGAVDFVLSFGPSDEPGVANRRLSPLQRVGLVAAIHPLAGRGSLPAATFARLPMLYSPNLPAHYMDPFVLADVRPLVDAHLVTLTATTTAHVAQRILLGREVTTVPLAFTANLTPELRRIYLQNLPDAFYYAHHRAGDERAEKDLALELLGELTASISAAAR